MRNAALELVSLGIRVNKIAPGAIAAPITRRRWRIRRRFSGSRGSCRCTGWEPRGVAEVALFVASDRSSYVTASTHFVD